MSIRCENWHGNPLTSELGAASYTNFPAVRTVTLIYESEKKEGFIWPSRRSSILKM
ncbi:hypothetical protein CLOSTASPAR_06466 [[Clostridium] asparagiforme DSM 15981]|uniref:Uncharacterized protein n=1 Tax=[Clostridium] asparagiforme DSM 15981 TaxID=518636 RepID=C0DB11_9FIRM|nr:hypothetical protein CLOSTASPAR_06466 [[Clostridium] asparagiforme DSM 15981]